MKTSLPHSCRGRSAGFTLLEALLLVTVLAIGGVGIGSALTSMARTPSQNNNTLAVETALLDKMEFLHSLPFATLAADVGSSPSTYTDLPTIEGTPVSRTVSIVYVDPTTSAVSAGATHMIQITVTCNSNTFVSLVNEP